MENSTSRPTSTVVGVQGTMDFFQHPYYRVNKILMSMIGQWPYQGTRISNCLRILLLLMVISHIVPQILFIVKYHDGWRISLDPIIPLLFDASLGAKVTCSLWNSEKMLELLNRIRTDWQVWAPEREVNVLHQYADRGRKMVIVYTVTLYSTCILFIIQPITPKIIDLMLRNGSKPGDFPTPVDYYHLDMQKHYFYIIMHSYVCISAAFIMVLAIDSMLIVYAQHACGIFAALGHKLQRIGENKRSAQMACALDERGMDFEHLVSCIDRHNNAIKYAELVETTFSWSFFFVVGFNILGMTVGGLQIVIGTSNPQRTTKCIVCYVTGTVHLYLENYLSQILIDHSNSIRNYIYSGKWYRLSLKAQKLLNLMIIRCDESCKLTAGKITTMSLETFAVCLKTSLSYFTVLRSL